MSAGELEPDRDLDYEDPFLEIRYALKRNAEEARRIRRLILAQTEAGVSHREVATRIGVPYGTFTYWIRLAREERDGAQSGTTTERLPRA